MSKHQYTIEDHVASNLACCLDLIGDFESPEDAALSYGWNTLQSCLEDGYSDDEAFDASEDFHSRFKKSI
jgi:hypothetical protein